MAEPSTGAPATGGPATGLPSAFAEAVLDVVAAIPVGEVRSYGEVAAAVGSRAPRAVGAVLARYGGGVPWWRVIRADGQLAPGHEAEAARMLAAEGLAVTHRGDRWLVQL